MRTTCILFLSCCCCFPAGEDVTATNGDMETTSTGGTLETTTGTTGETTVIVASTSGTTTSGTETSWVGTSGTSGTSGEDTSTTGGDLPLCCGDFQILGGLCFQTFLQGGDMTQFMACLQPLADTLHENPCEEAQFWAWIYNPTTNPCWELADDQARECLKPIDIFWTQEAMSCANCLDCTGSMPTPVQE